MIDFTKVKSLDLKIQTKLQAFPRDFPRLSDANNIVIRVTESGKLKELEDTFLTSGKCVDDDESFPNEYESLSPQSFSTLFVLTGGTSTVCLVVYILKRIRRRLIRIM